MGTKNTIALISGGTTYYLSGGAATQTSYAGSGTPWTAESTTPYELSLNDTTGNIWVPQAAPAQTIWSGGPSFRLGRSPLYRSYDNITETVGIQLRATTKDNAIALLRQFIQALNTALFSAPCVLSVQGGTNTAYYEIYSADAQENELYLREPDGVFRATITWVRSPFGGVSSLTTLINGTSYGNGSGSANTVSLGALTGDLVYEGMPMNIRLVPSAAGYDRCYVASVLSRTKSTVTSTVTGFTSTYPTGSAFTATGSISVTSLVTNAALRFRVLVRFTTLTNPTKAQIWGHINYGGAVGQRDVPLPIVTLGSDTTAQLIDLGGYPLDTLRNAITTAPNVTVKLQVSSTDGTAVTLTLDYVETLLYYDFCSITGSRSASTDRMYLLGAQNLNGSAYLPSAIPGALITTNTDTVRNLGVLRGTLPRAFSGASLYATTVTSGTNAHTASDTITVTAQLAPLYRTLRGGT